MDRREPVRSTLVAVTEPERRDGRPAFVLHEHLRPRRHFDLRLEENGVLRSWAVPKGLPPTPADDRLAIAVSDHDLDHLEYTDDAKFIADIGWWEEERRDERRMVFVLHGRRDDVRYALIATGGKDWLLHRMRDQDVEPERRKEQS